VANTDSFIDEVTEEVRRDRLFRVFRRYGWIAVVAVVALVGGAAWNEWQKAQALAKAQAFGDTVLGALDAPDTASREAALQDVTVSGGQAALVALLAVADTAGSADAVARESALARLRAVAADTAVPVLWRDLVQLRLLAMPGGEPDAALRKQTLDRLAAPGAPFRPLALEQQAFDLLAAGDRAGALAGFRALSDDPATPSALRGRAGQMMVVLGGDAQN
jgi:hypothetical protein